MKVTKAEILSESVIQVKRASPVITDGNGLAVYFLDVTPKLAEDLLKRNMGNRDVRRGMVNRFVKEIEEESWLANGQPIHLTKGGIFGNGQHRLQAIIETGKTIRMLVVEGLAEEALDTLDEGTRRTPADRLKRRGVKRYKLVSASLNAIRIATFTRRPINVRGFWNLYTEYKKDYDWALRAIPEGHPATWSSVYGALVFAHRTHPTQTEAFFKDAKDLKDREADDPVFVFNRVITNIQFEKNDYNTRFQIFRQVCATIRAHAEGSRIVRARGAQDAVEFFQIGSSG